MTDGEIPDVVLLGLVLVSDFEEESGRELLTPEGRRLAEEGSGAAPGKGFRGLASRSIPGYRPE